MKKMLVCWVLVMWGGLARAQSVDPVSVIVAKVIKTIDLKIQKLQNETIWLQQAQGLAENELSAAKLAEISGWQQQLNDLYAGYFKELKQVKTPIVGSSQVRRIIAMQQQVIIEYGKLAKDTRSKIDYDALLNTSSDVLQTLYSVLSSAYSMRDAERICMITTLKDAMSHCLVQIKALNQEQWQRAASKARMAADLQFVKQLNGVQ